MNGGTEGRGPGPWGALVAVLALALLAWSAAQGVTIESTATKTSAPGDYVTVPFVAQGDGTFRFAVAAPLGWAVVNGDFTEAVHGRAVLLVTLRVAPGAAPGIENPVSLTAFQADKRVASATASVKVAKAAGVDLRAPSKVTSLPGAAHSFKVYVTNTGNFTDSFEIQAIGTVFTAVALPRSITLPPEGSAAVRVSVTPTGNVSNGFSQLIIVKVVSETDDHASANARVDDRYLNPALPSLYGTPQSHSPKITFGVSSTLDGTLVLGSQPPEGSLRLSVTPSLSGDLSDFVRGSLNTGAVSSDLTHPVPGFPGFEVQLAGDRWTASTAVQLTGATVDGTLRLGSWNLDARANYGWNGGGYGARVNGERQTASSNLKLGGQLQRSWFQGAMYGTDLVSASYARDLGLGFSGRFAVSALGLQQPSRGYVAVPSVDERLSWQDSALDVTQTYTGQPTLGLHTVGLAGGTRTLDPLGVRTTNVLQVRGGAVGLDNKVSVYGSVPLVPPRSYGASRSSLDLQLIGGVNVGDASISKRQFEVSPGADLSMSWPGGISASTGLYYTHVGGLAGAAASDQFQVQAGGYFGNAGVSVSGSYHTSYDPHAGFRHGLELDASGGYALSADTQFGVQYVYSDRREAIAGANVIHDSGSVDWLQQWPVGLSTDLSYHVDLYPHAPGLSTHGLELTGTFAPPVLPELYLQASYGIEAPFGVLTGSALTHRFAFSLGYALSVPFATPKSIVDAFGGRKTGRVTGRAYTKEPDGSTQPLPGVVLTLGDTTITTTTDGTFDARVPVGTYPIRVGGKVPANVGYFGAKSIDVRRDQTQHLALAFEPVGSMDVLLFNDENRNGKLDSGENGIAYGGVVLHGPEDKTLVANDAGHARVTELPAGSYTVAPDPSRLPSNFEPTTAPRVVRVRPGTQEARVSVGAALPKPKVVTTFVPGTPSIFVVAKPQNVPAGAEVTLTAQVGGGVTAVTGRVLGEAIVFHEASGEWVAKPRIPLRTPPGPLAMTVTAKASSKKVSQNVTVSVVRAPPFQAAIFRFVAGSKATLEIDTLFKAQHVEVELPGGTTVRLRSTDGYRWTGSFQAPQSPGDIKGKVVGDGQDLGTVNIQIAASK